MQSAEVSFRDESSSTVEISRDVTRVVAGSELADAFEIAPDSELVCVVTRAAEDGRPISISDTYQLGENFDIDEVAFLEETLADRLPAESHAAWLRTGPGELVKQVHQRFVATNGSLVMISDISYPRDRYDAFTFRMSLTR